MPFWAIGGLIGEARGVGAWSTGTVPPSLEEGELVVVSQNILLLLFSILHCALMTTDTGGNSWSYPLGVDLTIEGG
jgi:hypothetical protein